MAKKNTQLTAESRRTFIKKAGKLAIYTPPAIVMLMQPSFDAFAKSGGWCPPGLEQFNCQPPGQDDKPWP